MILLIFTCPYCGHSFRGLPLLDSNRPCWTEFFCSKCGHEFCYRPTLEEFQELKKQEELDPFASETTLREAFNVNPIKARGSYFTGPLNKIKEEKDGAIKIGSRIFLLGGRNESDFIPKASPCQKNTRRRLLL